MCSNLFGLSTQAKRPGRIIKSKPVVDDDDDIEIVTNTLGELSSGSTSTGTDETVGLNVSEASTES